jgi:hypothetical protein
LTSPNAPSVSSFGPSAMKRVCVPAPPLPKPIPHSPLVFPPVPVMPTVKTSGWPLAPELAEELPGVRVKGADVAVAEVAEQQHDLSRRDRQRRFQIRCRRCGIERQWRKAAGRFDRRLAQNFEKKSPSQRKRLACYATYRYTM